MYLFPCKPFSLRLKPIAACLSATLVLSSVDSPAQGLALPRATNQNSVGGKTPAHPNASTWPVTSCANDGAGSLRAVVAAPTTQSGDIVDLSSVPMGCSVITLDTGITVGQADLTLMDGTTRPSQLQISAAGGGTDRVIDHVGNGTLAVMNLTVSNGYLLSNVSASGGCIHSAGSVNLFSSWVSNCTAVATNGVVRGGGVVASGTVTLFNSTISGCTARATNSNQASIGGGIYAYGGINAKYSTISNNTAIVVGGSDSLGGALAIGNIAIPGASIQIYGSTLSGNKAYLGSAIWIDAVGGPGTISDSTISGNMGGAGAVNTYAPLTLQNSTVADNYASSEFGGIYIGGTALALQSSILANNTEGPNNAPSDLHVSTLGSSSVSGANNLVMASTGLALPQGVVTTTADPKLGQLQFNGGRTQSHALLPGSPAIGAGNNLGMLTSDQRGSGYPRTTGGASTVDIGAIQFDSIFAGGFEF